MGRALTYIAGNICRPPSSYTATGAETSLFPLNILVLTMQYLGARAGSQFLTSHCGDLAKGKLNSAFVRY